MNHNLKTISRYLILILYKNYLDLMILMNYNKKIFYKCGSLISLNLSNFNTKLIKNMSYMFGDCASLNYLNLDNFNTSLVTSMNGMFYNCSSLLSLDLKSFNLSNNQETGLMFKYCKSLKTLDLGNFQNVKLTNMTEMFSECESLLSLDISGFNISLISDMSNLFYNCKSLISLDLKHFDDYNVSETIPCNNMFDNCNKTLIYCINGNQKILDQLTDFPNNNCSNPCFTNSLNKFIIEKAQCIDNCSNDDYYKYEYNNICYHLCPYGTHKSSYNEYSCEDTLCNYYNYDLTGCLDNIPMGYYLKDIDLRTIDKCNIKCLNCTYESNEIGLCASCNMNESYYPKYNDISNNNSFTNCYKGNIENYYLDEKQGIYMPCYSICKSCKYQGDKNQNNCTECYDNYTLTGDGNCQEISIDSTQIIENIISININIIILLKYY